MNQDNNDLDKEINDITQRIEDINIQRTRLLQEELQYERELRILRNKQQRQRNAQDDKEKIIRRDRDGKVIHIGDRVRFLTRGTFKVTEGEVKSFGRRFVVSLGEEGFEINRLAKNLRVIESIKQDN